MSLEKFEPFIQELIKWNKSINLVQEKTINDIYNRHILE
jgi:16S rRNA G527 N7-methylase RsmG